jgi:AraC-like DNA-binding protein
MDMLVTDCSPADPPMEPRTRDSGGQGAADAAVHAESSCLVTGTLLRYVQERGGDARELAAAHGFAPDAIGARETAISVEARAALFDAAARLLDDPFLGLHMVRSFERGHFGPLEYLMATAPDVGEAHRRLSQYAPLLNPRTAFSWTEQLDGRGVLRHHVIGNPAGAGRHAHELTICGLIAGLRRNVGSSLQVERVWFAHARPPAVDELRDFLGTANLEFDATDNGYLLPAGAVTTPMISADARLSALIAQLADALLIARITPPDLLGDVRASIRASLSHRGQILDNVAARMGTSSRTLQRRLRDLGHRFHDVLAEVRREQAMRMVATTRNPLSEIAKDLGYSDFANFLRAFKRWTGTTPGQLRKRSWQPPRR